MKQQMQMMMGLDEKEMQKIAEGKKMPQMQSRPHKGKGKNKGGLCFCQNRRGCPSGGCC